MLLYFGLYLNFKSLTFQAFFPSSVTAAQCGCPRALSTAFNRTG